MLDNNIILNSDLILDMYGAFGEVYKQIWNFKARNEYKSVKIFSEDLKLNINMPQ